MIVFEKIRWKNFLSYGNYFTQISLDKSEMTLICGENGAGKTTFLDAICFCRNLPTASMARIASLNASSTSVPTTILSAGD